MSPGCPLGSVSVDLSCFQWLPVKKIHVFLHTRTCGLTQLASITACLYVCVRVRAFHFYVHHHHNVSTLVLCHMHQPNLHDIGSNYVAPLVQASELNVTQWYLHFLIVIYFTRRAD